MTAKRALRAHLEEVQKSCDALDFFKIAIISYLLTMSSTWYKEEISIIWWSQLSYHERLKLKRVPNYLKNLNTSKPTT